MALMHVEFFSEVLGMCMNMDVILPQKTHGQIGMEGGRGEGKYKTLYLLHGMSDNHTIWQRRTSIERYVSEMGIAVVMPAVQLSYYTNMKHGLRYWDFISRELPAICREFFPAMSERRQDTFAAGLSMGGYGAFKLALGAPDTFCAAAALSGVLDIRSVYDRNTTEGNARAGLFTDIFGSAAELRNSENDLFYLAEQLKKSGRELPKLYFWCGTEDELYGGNLACKAHLEELGYDFVYEESPGDHLWSCWDLKIQAVLKWLEKSCLHTDGNMLV